MNDIKPPVVSVYMITYNHGNFIAQAIEGVLMQQTNFSVELVIGEDCSTDNTRQVCLEYKEKYPDRIKLVLSEKNLGVGKNGLNTFAACLGKYIAICEGDDYWTDPLKLQKQVDFLESHPDYTICGGRYMVLEDGKPELREQDWMIRGMKKYPKGRTVNLNDYFDTYLLWMLTICVRRDCLSDMSKFKLGKDDVLYSVALDHGKGFVFSDYFGVYRLHQGGVWTGKTIKQRLQENEVFLHELYPHFADKSRSLRKKYFKEIVGLRFFELTESNHLFKDYMKMVRFVFSGKLNTIPFHVVYFSGLTRKYFAAYCKKKLFSNSKE